jgi:integral membrane protein
MQNAIKLFKIISVLEALSFLALLILAYVLELPKMVTIVGMAHGILFMLYIAMAVYISTLLKWNAKTLFIVIICSVLPFGPFYADKKYLP